MKDIATDIVEPELNINNNWYYENFASILKEDADNKLKPVYNFSSNPKYTEVNYY